VIGNGFTTTDRAVIANAITWLEQNTCLKYALE
jgi:hypothetical protein